MVTLVNVLVLTHISVGSICGAVVGGVIGFFMSGSITPEVRYRCQRCQSHFLQILWFQIIEMI